MAFLEWYDTYSVHVDEIDRQHKQLVQMINKLHESIIQNRVEEEIGNTLTALVEYTKRHFADEEHLMMRIGYPHLHQHRILHQKLRDQIAEILKRLRDNDRLTVFELMGFLRAWLVDHILREDRKIGEMVAQKAGFSEPPVASDRSPV